MAEPLADQVTRKIDQAAELYHRLLMVAAPAGMGKTSALHDVHERNGAPPSPPWRGVRRGGAVSVMNGCPVEYLNAASAAVLAFPRIFLGLTWRQSQDARSIQVP